ncbi:Transcriptional activator NphR [compost metagenome]
MKYLFDTDGVVPRERTTYWQEVVCETFVQLDCRIDRGESFSGRLHVHPLADLSVVDVAASEQSVIRSRQRIARTEKEFVLVSLALEGSSVVVQDGREAVLGAGSFAIYDTRSPYELHFDGSFRQVVVQIPRTCMQQRLDALEYLTAIPLSRHQPLERLTFDFLKCLTDFEDFPVLRQLQLSEQALDLLAMTLAERGRGKVPEDLRCTALLFRIKEHVLAHIGDSDLSLQRVANHFGLTPRYVNSLLHREGVSFGRYVLIARLHRCARALRQPEQSNRQISEIAYQWGFTDMAYFSRVFKAQFGMSPRQYRNESK